MKPPQITAHPRLLALVAVVAAAALAAPVATASAAQDDVELVSRAGGPTGAKGNDESFAPALSADGRFVAFVSDASNLVPGDSNLDYDVFVSDVETSTVTLVSRAAGGNGASGDSFSEDAAVSADGRFVAFSSAASNLHADDSDPGEDVFVRDLQANTTRLVSRAPGAAGAKGNDVSFRPAVSADGRFIAFTSDASNLHPDDSDPGEDVFVRDLQANTTTLVSRATGTTGAKGNDRSNEPAVSADGRYVAFASEASNLHADDSDTSLDVFVRDLQANTTTLVSRAAGATGAKGNDGSFEPALSADGRVVAFASPASNLHPDDSDAVFDVFVRDLQANTTTLVSRSAGAAGAKGDVESYDPAVSADGRYVAFTSDASNLHSDDSDTGHDVFVRDLQASTTTLVSRAAGATGAKGNSFSFRPALSADGRFVAFASLATNLHPADSDTVADVFRRDVLGPPPPPTPTPTPQPPPPAPSPPLAPPSLQDRVAPVISITGVRGRRGRCTARNFGVRVRIRDSSGLRSARLVIDGRRRLITTKKRFRVLIRASQLRSGRHRLTVTATDRAGNRGSRSVRFTRCARPS